MISSVPWYFNSNSLDELNFKFPILEKEKVISFYSSIIDFNHNDFDFFSLSKFKIFDFLEDDYSNEERTEVYIKSFLYKKKYLYAIPLVFSVDEFFFIKNGVKPPLIAKVKANIREYKKCVSSFISDYSGEFILINYDFSSFLIVNNGHYFIKIGEGKNDDLNWNRLLNNEIELYDYDKSFLLKIASLRDGYLSRGGKTA